MYKKDLLRLRGKINLWKLYAFKYDFSFQKKELKPAAFVQDFKESNEDPRSLEELLLEFENDEDPRSLEELLLEFENDKDPRSLEELLLEFENDKDPKSC